MIAIVSVYASIFGLFKVNKALSAKPPVPTPVAAAPVESSGTTSKWGFDPPTMDNFDAWEKNDDNWKKWEEFMSGPLLDKWCDSLE